jgi:hypothetical protein
MFVLAPPSTKARTASALLPEIAWCRAVFLVVGFWWLTEAPSLKTISR